MPSSLALAVLARGRAAVGRPGDNVQAWKSAQDLVTRTRALAALPWTAAYDHVVFHEGDLNEHDQAMLADSVPDIHFQFVNVVYSFTSRLAHAHRSTALSAKHNCEPTAESLVKGPGYAAMCAFWFVDIPEVLGSYEYMLRIDDDILPHPAMYPAMGFEDPTPMLRAAGAHIASPAYVRDSSNVTRGLEAFFASLASLRIQAPGGPTTARARFNWSWVSDQPGMHAHGALCPEREDALRREECRPYESDYVRHCCKGSTDTTWTAFPTPSAPQELDSAAYTMPSP